jgi:hypothetical protein
MIAIENTIISEEIITEKFVCNIEACKAACCVEGDLGAPLTREETIKLDSIYSKIKPYLSESGRTEIEIQGKWILDEDGDWSTPTISGKECAYSVYDDKGILKCGIEQAFENGAVDFRKPISCHLYPIRVKEHKEFVAVNYHRWNICQPACALGQTLGVPVYKFLKEALKTKFGENWYKELELVADAYLASKLCE